MPPDWYDMVAEADLPLAFSVLETQAELYDSVAVCVRMQVDYARRCLRLPPESQAVTLLEQRIRATTSGMIAVEGSSGFTVDSLLVAVSVRHPYPLWLGGCDGGQGGSALCAQLIALEQPALRLIDPAADDDPVVLEQMLTALAARRSEEPLVLLVAAPAARHDRYPRPLPLPPELPPGVVLVYGCEIGAALPYTPVARMPVPRMEPQAFEHQLRANKCPPAWIAPLRQWVGDRAELELALSLLRTGMVVPSDRAQDLHTLLSGCWSGMPPGLRRLLALLVAADQPLPVETARLVVGTAVDVVVQRWCRAGLVSLYDLEQDDPEGDPEAKPTQTIDLHHSLYHDWIRRHAAAEVAAAHAILVQLALPLLATGSTVGGRHAVDVAYGTQRFILQTLARHAAHAPAATRRTALNALATRTWVRARLRRDGARAAFSDACWLLRALGSDGPLLLVVRAALLAAGLANQSRTVSTSAAVAALQVDGRRSEREAILKHVLVVVDRVDNYAARAHTSSASWARRSMLPTCVHRQCACFRGRLDLEAAADKPWRT
jgi:HAMP domain-containing protein